MLRCRLARLARSCGTLLALTAFFGCCAGTVRPVSAQTTFAYFDEPLSPYGYWVDDPSYGRVWRPRDPSVDWRPYMYGRWAYTSEYGWVWVSDEPWGWV